MHIAHPIICPSTVVLNTSRNNVLINRVVTQDNIQNVNTNVHKNTRCKKPAPLLPYSKHTINTVTIGDTL